jgi:hypothetical protein
VRITSGSGLVGKQQRDGDDDDRAAEKGRGRGALAEDQRAE